MCFTGTARASCMIDPGVGWYHRKTQQKTDLVFINFDLLQIVLHLCIYIFRYLAKVSYTQVLSYTAFEMLLSKHNYLLKNMTRPDSFRAYSASLVICIHARFVVFSCVYFGLLLPLFFSFCSLTPGQSRGYNLKNIPKTQMLQNSVYIIWDPITMTSREHTSKKPSKHLITDPMAPLWGELTGGRWIPLTKGQSRRKQFHVMTSACTVPCQWSLVSWWWHRMAVELLWIRSLWWCNVLVTAGRRYTMMMCM